ncbi:MAG: IclR family transcriptional regulator [Rhizobiales bacterium]|nr:IclR family transcriptional regulator [Hyphomicrobiales bacterium]
MDQDKSLQKLVPAVERAAGILDLISASKRFLTVSELSRETNLPKSTVHSLCVTMTQLGLLIRRSDQTYVLGPHLLRWSNGFDRQTDVATEFALLCDDAPLLEHATASLSVPEEADMVFIAARQTLGGNRFAARPGMRLPAAFVAAGKAVLSLSADFDVRRSYADGFPAPLTENSVSSLDELLKELGRARETGVVNDIGQCIEGVTNISAPVLNALNKPLAAIMLSAPSELVEGPQMEELSHLVISLANRLSHRMGAAL